MDPTATPADIDTLSLSNGIQMPVGLFDAVTQESLAFQFPAPINWDGAEMRARICYTALPGSTTGESAQLGIRMAAVGSNSLDVTLPSYVVDSLTMPAALEKQVGAWLTVDPLSSFTSDLLIVEVTRIISGPMTEDLPLISIHIAYGLTEPAPQLP